MNTQPRKQPPKKRLSAPPPDLRRTARLHYIATSQSLAEMQATTPFHAVTLRTLESWAAADGWVEARKQHEEEVQRRALEKVGGEQLAWRLQVLARLKQVHDGLLNNLLKHPMESKSLEGQVGALVRLGEYARLSYEESEALTKLAASVREKVSPLVPNLSVEEARAGARAIWEHRRAQQQAQNAASEQEEENE